MAQNTAHKEPLQGYSDGGFQVALEAHCRGALEDAVAGYRRVVADTPAHVDAWGSLCVAYLAQGRSG